MATQKRKRSHGKFKGRAPPRPAFVSGIYQLLPSPRTGLKLGGRYEILGLIDRGGSSEVYLARDGVASLPVIVKMLTEEAARSIQYRERFVAGARSTMAIDHPAVGRVHCVVIDPNVPPYLIMEALEGESLSQFLDRDERMSERLTVKLALVAAAGLIAAHNAGIVHRDIKPGNLYLLGPVGAPNGLKIIDFGLSKDLRHSGSGPASVNLVLGTAQYMAPEQVLADPIDVRTDIYAFGAVLFRMLTGQLPFDLNPGADLFCHQIFSAAPPPSWLLEDIDPRLEQLVLRCLRKHPENRFDTMQEMHDELVQIESHAMTSQTQVVVPVLRHHPDVYVPRNSKGRQVANELARGSGTPPCV